MSQSRPGSNLNLSAPWIKEAERYFTREVSPLPWPVRNFFFCERAKILYSPIPKVACTSLKSLMTRLSGIEHADKVLQFGIHRTTDVFATGAQLKDHEAEKGKGILTDASYYKFAVVRDPVERIVSAYTDKFFLNRLGGRNRLHTLDILQAVRCESTPDLEQGISFRSFVDFLLGQPPETLDVHWRPQCLFLTGVDQYDNIFALEQIDELAKKLSSLSGEDISLGKQNASVAKATAGDDSEAGKYADLPPPELDGKEGVTARDFMAPDLVASLETYFEEDTRLYQDALKSSPAYIPPPALRGRRRKRRGARTLNTAPEIANWAALYCKGYFALDESGRGALGIVISNTGGQTLDFTALPSCSLQYVPCDKAGAHLAPPATQRVAVELLRSAQTFTETLNIEVSGDIAQDINMVKVSLLFGDAFDVGELQPLHATSAQRVRASGD